MGTVVLSKGLKPSDITGELDVVPDNYTLTQDTKLVFGKPIEADPDSYPDFVEPGEVSRDIKVVQNAYGVVVVDPKPPVQCSYLAYDTSYAFVFAIEDIDGSVGITTSYKKNVKITNLYHYPGSVSEHAHTSIDALTKHLKCLFLRDKNSDEINVSIIDPNNLNNLNKLFQDAIRIKRNASGAVEGKPFYYCNRYEKVPDENEEDKYVHIYYLKKVKRNKITTGGSSPSIARWMGVIAGTFVVAASALVPRMG